MNNLKCLIVNWDGVCVSSLEARHLAYLETFRKLKLNKTNWTVSDTVKQSGRNPDEIWIDQSLWHEKGGEAKEIFYNAYTNLSKTHIKLNENVAAFLSVFKLRCPDTPIVAFGAKTEEIMWREVSQLLENDPFNMIYGSRSGSEHNKNLDKPEALRTILQDLNLCADSQTVYLGYKDSDAEAARNAGIAYQNGQVFMLDYLSKNLGVCIKKADVMPHVCFNERVNGE